MKRLLAITHTPSPNMGQCELTHREREPITHALALRQHQGYCEALRGLGVAVVTLDANLEYPDCVFVEDTAVVLDEVAILASPGAESRRAELAGVEPELRKYREVTRIELPATLDGGDVFRVGRELFVGLSSRTNQAGVDALATLAGPFGYTVRPVPVHGCLHLKSACTPLPDGSLLVNRPWLDADALEGHELIPVPEDEPGAADVLCVDQTVCMVAGHPRTAEVIRARGFAVEPIYLSEFTKAEGAVTCLSLLLTHHG